MFLCLIRYHSDCFNAELWNRFYPEIQVPDVSYCNKKEKLPDFERFPQNQRIFAYKCKFSNLQNRAIYITKSYLNLLHVECSFIKNSLPKNTKITDIDQYIDYLRGACIYVDAGSSQIKGYRFFVTDCHLPRETGTKYSAGLFISINNCDNHTIEDATISYCGGEDEGSAAIHSDKLDHLSLKTVNVSSVTSYTNPVGYFGCGQIDNIKFCNIENNKVSNTDNSYQGNILWIYPSLDVKFENCNFINNILKSCGSDKVIHNQLHSFSSTISFIHCSFISGSNTCGFFSGEGYFYLDHCYIDSSNEDVSINRQNRISNTFTNHIQAYTIPIWKTCKCEYGDFNTKLNRFYRFRAR